MLTFRRTNRAARQNALRLATFALLLAAPGSAHDPHQPAAPAPPPATASAGVPSPAALPLPTGWVESPPPAADRAFAPMLTADGDGILATWLEALPAGGHRLRFARWSGGSWSAATTVREGKTLFANWADVPGVVRAADRALYAWWLERSAPSGEAYEAQLARSTDEGGTFKPLGALHEDHSAVEHGFVSAVAEGGGVRFYFLDGRGTATGGSTELRSTVVAGERIAASELMDDRVCDCCSTAAVALAGGSAVAYRDRTAAEIRDIRFAIRPAGGSFRTQPIGEDRWKISGCPVNGPALAADRLRLAVAWYSAPEDQARMAIALSNDGGATWSAPQPLAAARPQGHLALAPLADGFALAWVESGSGGIGGKSGTELRLAFSDKGGAVGPAVTVAHTGAGRAGGIPRLARTADRLALGWVDAEAHRLRFATLPVERLSSSN